MASDLLKSYAGFPGLALIYSLNGVQWWLIRHTIRKPYRLMCDHPATTGSRFRCLISYFDRVLLLSCYLWASRRKREEQRTAKGLPTRGSGHTQRRLCSHHLRTCLEALCSLSLFLVALTLCLYQGRLLSLT